MNFLTFPALDATEVQQVVSALAKRPFQDGKATAGGLARAVKNNLQTTGGGPAEGDLDRIVLSALSRNEEFRRFAFPKRLLLPTYARYTPGMEYGWHLDDAIMGSGEPLRTDLAATIFLAGPDTYDGGELVLDLPSGEQEIKLAAGEAIVYPATTIHRVAQVTRGERLVAITWIQSTVRDERIRAILYDLALAAQKAEREPEAAMLINKGYQNLLRYAADL